MGERRTFDKAFKEQVVLRILSGDSTTSKMADEVGAYYTTVKEWVKNYKRDGNNTFPGSGNNLEEIVCSCFEKCESHHLNVQLGDLIRNHDGELFLSLNRSNLIQLIQTAPL